MYAQWKCHIWLTATFIVVAVLAGAFPDEPVAHAQGEDHGYVDVGIFLEVPHDIQSNNSHELRIIVVNQGTRTAYDVEVVVDVVSPARSRLGDVLRELPKMPLGSATLDGTALVWTIPALGRLQHERVIVQVNHVIFEGGNEIKDNSEYPHELFGEVTTSSYDSNLSNNTARVWSYDYSTTNANTRQVLGNYSVSVSVDDPNPSPGDAVNFTITADRANPYTGSSGSAHTPPPIDLKVDIELTDGLNVTGTPTYAPATDRADSVSYSDGVFTIGTLKQGKSRTNSVTLPITVANGAIVNEQCLTAKLTGNPPPGIGRHDDDISDNEARLCLGQERPYFSTADITEFTSHPCVGNTDPPCDATDDIRVRAVDETFDPPLPLVAETPLISVPDNVGTRKYDDDANSVNSANIVSWQTPVDISLDEYSSEHERWSNASISISYEMLNKNDDFDKVHFRGTVNALLSNSQRSVTVLSGFNIGASGNGPFELTGEFEKLSTYKVSQTVTATHDNNTDGDTSDDVVYTATGSYIFHVGPMADLKVEDGGASSHVADDQQALTIVAVNNGPDKLSGARVTGLPKDAERIHISHGTYHKDAGVWNIDELKVRGYYGSRGESEPTLVLAATAGDDPAEVTIASSKNYEVCVGPKSNPGDLAHTTKEACEAVPNASWNSTPVYDYNSGNNTAKITAVKGTGGAWPDELRFAATPLLTWEAVPHVNDWPVHRYQVQYLNGDNWLDLADVPGDQTYFADSERPVEALLPGAGAERGRGARLLVPGGVPGRVPAGVTAVAAAERDGSGRPRRRGRGVLGAAGGRRGFAHHLLPGAVVAQRHRRVEQRLPQ